MMIFLCQNVLFGIQDRSSALRPPSHFSRSTEEFTESQYEKERIKTYIEELLKEKEGCIYEAADHSYEIITPDARISLRECPSLFINVLYLSNNILSFLSISSGLASLKFGLFFMNT